MRRRERGSSLVLVLGVLATVLLDDLRATRRRVNERYAAELARSGTDWARGALLAKGGRPSAKLEVERGEIVVATDELPDGNLRVVSTGRVKDGETSLAARRETTVFPPPPPK